jgi:hypothetical protein
MAASQAREQVNILCPQVTFQIGLESPREPQKSRRVPQTASDGPMRVQTHLAGVAGKLEKLDVRSEILLVSRYETP